MTTTLKRIGGRSTTFVAGDVVMADSYAQGLAPGRTCTVESVAVRRVLGQQYVTVTVHDGQQLLPIVNGHLLLRHVRQPRPCVEPSTVTFDLLVAMLSDYTGRKLRPQQVEAYADRQVPHTYAVRVSYGRRGRTCRAEEYLVRTRATYGERVEEVAFTCWPPQDGRSGNSMQMEVR